MLSLGDFLIFVVGILVVLVSWAVGMLWAPGSDSRALFTFVGWIPGTAVVLILLCALPDSSSIEDFRRHQTSVPCSKLECADHKALLEAGWIYDGSKSSVSGRNTYRRYIKPKLKEPKPEVPKPEVPKPEVKEPKSRCTLL